MLLGRTVRERTAAPDHQGAAAPSLRPPGGTLPEDQMLLGLEDVEQTAASDEATADQAAPAERTARAPQTQDQRGSLPRICRDRSSSPTSTTRLAAVARASCTGSAKTRASGWTWCRRKFRCSSQGGPNTPCRSCRGRRHPGAGSSPADRGGGLPTEATVAQVLVSKYADHLPLYRQAQIYARQGIDLDRSTLADWVGHAALAPGSAA